MPAREPLATQVLSRLLFENALSRLPLDVPLVVVVRDPFERDDDLPELLVEGFALRIGPPFSALVLVVRAFDVEGTSRINLVLAINGPRESVRRTNQYACPVPLHPEKHRHHCPPLHPTPPQTALCPHHLNRDTNNTIRRLGRQYQHQNHWNIH